jgi:hypothetical protein
MRLSRLAVHEKIKSIPTLWLSLFIVALMLLRAWPRLFYPEVWDEDGTRNLAGFLTNGIADLWQPVNGYLIVIPKLITILSVSTSLTLYPLISIVLAWAFILFVLLVIAKAPIHLKGGVFLVFLCMLIPSDAENFGLPLYTFWWSALLLFVLVFWNEKFPNLWFRLPVIALASLSSPVCIITLPLFLTRAYIIKRNTAELIVAITASIFAGIQLWSMWPIASAGGNSGLNLLALQEIIPVFLGSYTAGNFFQNLNWIFGLLTLSYVLVGLIRHKSSWVIWTLCYLWSASVLMSITRVDINILNLALSGPRYFFFPFMILSWILLQLSLNDTKLWFRFTGICLLILSLINAIPVLYRQHDNLNWKDHISSCAHFSQYGIPVHFDGNISRAWSMSLEGNQCADLLQKDIFASLASKKTYPYQRIQIAIDTDLQNINAPEFSQISKNEWFGYDYDSTVTGKSSAPSGYKVIGSYIASDTDTGSITLRIHRGQQILFRTDSRSGLQRIEIMAHEESFFDEAPAAPKWVILDFSNRLLPEEFDVKFIDAGKTNGEWSAIAIKNSSPH